MAAAAEAYADSVMLTSDNPRTESPQAILAEMITGLKQAQAVVIEPDRAIAIDVLVNQMGAKDVVLVAGKGHETYQEIQGVRHDFSDVEHVQAALQRRAARLSNAPQGAQA